MMYRLLAVIGLLATASADPDPHLPTPSHDRVAPVLPAGLRHAVLIVSKTNGWRHVEHIPRSNAALADMARSLGIVEVQDSHDG